MHLGTVSLALARQNVSYSDRHDARLAQGFVSGAWTVIHVNALDEEFTVLGTARTSDSERAVALIHEAFGSPAVARVELWHQPMPGASVSWVQVVTRDEVAA